jgi:hypothetical protein
MSRNSSPRGGYRRLLGGVQLLARGQHLRSRGRSQRGAREKQERGERLPPVRKMLHGNHRHRSAFFCLELGNRKAALPHDPGKRSCLAIVSQAGFCVCRY